MPLSPTISEAEWEVMQVIWDRGASTASEVIEALAGRRQWNPRTIKTLLGRLLKKGALQAAEQGNRYVYRAAVKREASIRAQSKSFLKRVFGGDAMSAMVHLAQQAELSADDLDELKRMLKENQS